MMQHRHWGMAAAAVAAFAVLWFAVGSQAGWLIRAQATASAGGRLVGWVDDQTVAGRQNERAREAQIAQEKPNDFALQMAVALRNVPPEAALSEPNRAHLPLDELSGQTKRTGLAAANRLQGLLPRFGFRPVPQATVLHATILRYLSLEAVRLPDRGEADLLSAKPRTAPSVRSDDRVNSPEALRQWEAACVMGAGLDPQNSFFPTMRAVGLFAQNRDAEAEAVLLDAGRLPYFNDYASDETRAMWHLMEMKSDGGEPGAVPRLAQSVSLTFPHYALLRQVARVATVRAMRAEINGDREKGFKIRHAVAHLGAVMRSSGTGSILGALVGEAITEISYLRPGGVPASPSGNGWHEAIQTTYRAYLERRGHADEARFVLHENAARKQISEIFRTAQAKDDVGLFVCGTYARLAAAWAVGIALLSNALVVVLAGGAATLYCRFLRPAFAGACLAHRIVLHAGIISAVGAGLVALACFGGTGAAFGLGCGLIGAYEYHQHETERVFNRFAVGASSVAGVLVPLVVGLVIKSRRARVSVGNGIAHGLVRWALPVTAGLLLAYAGVTTWTLQEEARLTQSQKRTVEGEGPYYAELTNQPWPGLFHNIHETNGAAK